MLLTGCNFLRQVENNGVPFDRERLEIAQQIMQEDIDEAVAKLYEFPEVRQFEAAKVTHSIQTQQFNLERCCLIISV